MKGHINKVCLHVKRIVRVLIYFKCSRIAPIDDLVNMDQEEMASARDVVPMYTEARYDIGII